MHFRIVGAGLGRKLVPVEDAGSYSSSSSGTSHNKNAKTMSAGVQASMAPNAMACTVVMIHSSVVPTLSYANVMPYGSLQIRLRTRLKMSST
jgi:hypothetical protein